jgi:hypothetical protein
MFLEREIFAMGSIPGGGPFYYQNSSENDQFLRKKFDNSCLKKFKTG